MLNRPQMGHISTENHENLRTSTKERQNPSKTDAKIKMIKKRKA